MDNVTHALIGVLLARATAPWVESRRGALWAALLASNVPDADILLNPFFEDARLGYLVHHRGHTHTLLGMVPLALGVAAFARWRDPAARPGPLLGLSLLAGALHIGADAWNNYGVHPFWPAWSDWLYGDFVFILEPWLWAALLPLAFVTFSARWARVGMGLGAAAMAALVAFGVGIPAAVLFVAVLVGLGALQLWRDGWGLAAAGVALTLAAFLVGSWRAERDLRREIARTRPGETLLDVSLTPRPGVPWCWSGIVASRDGETYHLRTVLHSQLPGLSPAVACAIPRGEGRTAPLRPADLPSDPAWAWGERFEAPFAELRDLARGECRVDAFLRFARMPFWTREGEGWVVGDLRYDFEPELGFAELPVVPGDLRGCDHLPPWRSAVAAAFVLP